MRRKLNFLKKPFKRFLQNQRMTSIERNWTDTARASDQLFVGRTLTRYRDHHALDFKLPPLPPFTSAPPIPQEAWDALYKPRHHMNPEPLVDIVIPVTHEYETVIPTLYRVLSSINETPFRTVLVLSDHPDSKLIAKLRRLQELDLFDLLQDGGEEGLIALTNFALQRHESRDAVLLASNTDLPDHWLDRLRDAARLPYGSVASASPWCLGGGISHYPDDTARLTPALGDPAQLDAFCYAIYDDGIAHALPEASGVCTYLPRESIRMLGLLNESEDDIAPALARWSEEASDRGFDHMLCARLLVGTFSADAVTADNDTPELAALRTRLDEARLRAGAVQPVLIIDGIPGAHIFAEKPSDIGALHLTPDPRDPTRIRLGLPDARLFPHLTYSIDDPNQSLIAFCESLGLTRIVIRQLAGFPSRMLEYTMLLADRLGIPIRLELADDYLICPGLLGTSKTCDAVDLESGYTSFAATHPLDADGIPLWLWRLRAAQLLSKSDSTHFLNDSLKALYERYYNIS